MKIRLFILLSLGLLAACSKPEEMKRDSTPLERLMNGNKRYIENRSEHPNRSEERRKEVASKQKPFAIIVSCSDSRVSPEIIFDEGLGDLFIVRVAGNVIGPLEQESINYAAHNLGSSIILVLGHQNCGAVNAVVSNQTEGISDIAKLIKPAVAKVKGMEDPLEKAIKVNALDMATFLKTSYELQEPLQNKKIAIYAGYYNLRSGKVEILDSPTSN